MDTAISSITEAASTLRTIAQNMMGNVTRDITQDVASSDVIMWEVILYFIGSLLILFIFDWYASYKIGGKKRPGYIMLKGHRSISILIMAAFTVVIGMMCLFADFTCTRGVLTYFGLPYLIALVYFMVKVFRRVRAETKGRGFG